MKLHALTKYPSPKHFSSLFILICFLFCFQLSCRPIRALGDNPEGEALKKIEALPNYQNGMFQNLYADPAPPASIPSTSNRRRKRSWTSLLKYFFKNDEGTKPTQPVPVMRTNLRQSFEKPTVIWFGHSSFLLKTKWGNFLFDPSFSGYAGPIPGLVTAFSGSNFYIPKDLPPIDAIVISHDHYDHLDYTTVKALQKKVARIVVPMGVGSHFRHWGFDKKKITELNWNDSIALNEKVRIISTPAHHRSNRTMEQRKTLWSSYVIEVDGYKIYFSGDTGYSAHFSSIGRQYGPIDLAMLECGQYNERWSRSHMFPWQTARAAQDLKARMVIPIHWAKFAESTHPWNEPVQRLLKSADSLGLPVSVPYIGQPYSIGDEPALERWWDFQ